MLAMNGAKRVFNRRTLTIARQPAAWQAVAVQQAWRLRGPCLPGAGVPPRNDQVTVIWPSEYRHPRAETFVQPLLRGFESASTVERRAIPQPFPGIVLFEVRTQNGTFPVAVDYYDFPPVNEDCLGDVALYFKMQYRRSGYEESRIVPGGYVAGTSSVYDQWCRLRELRRHPRTADVYGRFSLRYSPAIRTQATEIARRDPRFVFTGGTSLALHLQSLREAARARVCIDMPGKGAFCYRLVEYLAIGCCVVARRHEARMPVDLRDGHDIVYCEDDLSDLADLCAHYVENDDEREEIAAGAARFFDEHLHPVQLAHYYLRMCDGLS